MLETHSFATTLLLTLTAAPLIYIIYTILWPYISTLPAQRKLRALPGPPGVPILGNIPDMVRAPVHQQALTWANKYGKLYKLQFPAATAVVLTDPEDITRILRVERWPKFQLSYRNMTKLTLDDQPNILTEPSDSPYYRALRRAVTPAFATANLRQFFPVVVELSERVAAQIAAAGPALPVDMDAAAQRLTVDVIGRFAFDRDFGASAPGGGAATGGTNEALAAVQDLMTALQKQMNPINRWFRWLKEARLLPAARSRFDACVRSALQDLRAQPPAAHCLLAHLLAFTDPTTGKPLTPRRLRAETGIFWIAGFETTAHAIAWTLMFLATHPEAEARVAAELGSLGLLAAPGRPAPRAPAWSDLSSVPFTNAVIHESLRLMPPASGGTARQAPCDTVLAGHPIPRGTMTWMPFYAVQRAAHNWADPDAFRPERWLKAGAGQAQGGQACGGEGAAEAEAEADEVVAAAATQTARGWLPFSEGPRNCVGMSLALLELRVALAVLVGRFKFRLADEMGGVEAVVAASRQHITLKPGERGLLLHAEPRA